ncbi:hypothetical protein D3C87_1602030 [compost metagenome]
MRRTWTSWALTLKTSTVRSSGCSSKRNLISSRSRGIGSTKPLMSLASTSMSIGFTSNACAPISVKDLGRRSSLAVRMTGMSAEEGLERSSLVNSPPLTPGK